MELSKSAAGVLVAVSIAAGAAGSYYAARTNPEPVAEASSVASSQESPVPASNAAHSPAPIVRRETTKTATTSQAPVSNRSETKGAASESLPVAPTAANAVPEIAPPDVAAPSFAEFIIEPDTVFGVQFDGSVSSDTAAVEDAVTARVTRDVRVGEQVVIPAGAKVYGEVSLVERGGKVRDRSRIGVRFTAITATTGERVPITTDVVVRDGESPVPASAAKIGGGAVGGAIIGGLLGGGKGAAIGSTIGASAGTAVVMTGERKAAVFAAGTPVTIRLTRAAAVTIDK